MLSISIPKAEKPFNTLKSRAMEKAFTTHSGLKNLYCSFSGYSNTMYYICLFFLVFSYSYFQNQIYAQYTQGSDFLRLIEMLEWTFLKKGGYSRVPNKCGVLMNCIGRKNYDYIISAWAFQFTVMYIIHNKREVGGN